MTVNAERFRDILYQNFPPLRQAGVFKCANISPTREVLSKFAHSSPESLKHRVGNARTYIRPLQKDLDLSVIFDIPDGVSVFSGGVDIQLH